MCEKRMVWYTLQITCLAPRKYTSTLIYSFKESCPSGYFGDDCSEPCPVRSYGKECGGKCDCLPEACNHVVGCTTFQGIEFMNCYRPKIKRVIFYFAFNNKWLRIYPSYFYLRYTL